MTSATRRPYPKLYSDTEILDTLRAHADAATGLPRKAYQAAREDNEPSVPLVEVRFGSWNNALQAAGISQITRQPHQLRGAVRRWGDEEIVAAMLRCRAQHNGKLSIAIYETWRKAMSDPHAVPSCALIRSRMGWGHALSALAQTTD